MGGEGRRAQQARVVEGLVGLAAEAEGGRVGEAEGQEVATGGRDLGPDTHQQAVSQSLALLSGQVVVVGDEDEVEARGARGLLHLGERAAAVRERGVDVKDPLEVVARLRGRGSHHGQGAP